MAATRKSYLILGRLPSSPLFDSIKSKHSIAHIPTKGLSRVEVISRVSSLPQKTYTFVLILAESQHLFPINKELLGGVQIECLCKVGAGYDSIDVDYFTSKGIWVANAPNAVRIPTAEWAVALILATVKGLGIADKHTKSGRWREGLALRSNVDGMTLGIVGLGAIGKEVVKRMNPWGVNTIYSNRKPLSKGEEQQLKARYVTLDDLLSKSDIISLHCPLTSDTHHLLNSATLSKCKRGVFIINTSRGPVIDERALVEALTNRQVNRAGLDVFEREPQIEQELLESDNVILSPHYAAFTRECMSDLENEVLENTIAYIERGKPNTPVNEPKAAL